MITSTRPTLTSESIPGGPQVLTLDGEFDISHAPNVGLRMADMLAECDGDIVVDLRGVCFLDSRMVSTLVSAFRRADQRACKLIVVRPNPRVWRVFEVGGLSETLPSFETLRDALGYLATPA
jgi:anti-sigma B factor antagonist